MIHNKAEIMLKLNFNLILFPYTQSYNSLPPQLSSFRTRLQLLIKTAATVYIEKEKEKKRNDKLKQNYKRYK